MSQKCTYLSRLPAMVRTCPLPSALADSVGLLTCFQCPVRSVCQSCVPFNAEKTCIKISKLITARRRTAVDTTHWESYKLRLDFLSLQEMTSSVSHEQACQAYACCSVEDWIDGSVEAHLAAFRAGHNDLLATSSFCFRNNRQG